MIRRQLPTISSAELHALIAGGEKDRLEFLSAKSSARSVAETLAALLDGGVTEDGQPYLVMQYVRGVAITQYADAHRLPLRDRLRLFVTVCRAVQYSWRPREWREDGEICRGGGSRRP